MARMVPDDTAMTDPPAPAFVCDGPCSGCRPTRPSTRTQAARTHRGEPSMNRTNWKRIAWVTHAVALAVLLGAGIARADVDDAWITSKVKLKLITSQDVHGTPIDVDVDHGVVTLSGRVRSESERSQAEMIARRTDGVRVVHNQLQVVPEYSWRSVQMSDQKLRNNVRKALHNADLRDQRDTRIEVKRVRGGVVTLGGRAGSMDD